MAKSQRSFGRLLLQIALGLVLLVGGIWGVGKSGIFAGGGDPAVVYLKGINNILGICLAVIEIVAGFLLILELFIGDKFGKLDNILGWIIIIAFAILIVLGDILGGLIGHGFTLSWLYTTATHLVLLAAMWILND